MVDIIDVLNAVRDDDENFDFVTAKAKAHEVLKAIEKEGKGALAPGGVKRGATNTLIRTESNISSRSVKSSAITVT